MRKLSPQESALWQAQAGTAKPLASKSSSKSSAVARPVVSGSVVSGSALSSAKHSAVLSAKRGAISSAKRGALAPKPEIDIRTRRRLKRGDVALRRLDLHGQSLADAHTNLLQFVQAAARNGTSWLLVITGKDHIADDSAIMAGDRRGRIRREFPLWCAAPPLRPLILAYGVANANHGGAGAFYVRLRASK